MSDPVAELALASNAADVIIHKMIIDELNPVLEWLTEREEHWAGELRNALESKQIPERTVAELEAELAELRGKHEDYRARVGDPLLPRDDRAQAWAMVPFYEAEITAMGNRLDQARADLGSAEAVVNKTRAELEAVQHTKQAVGWAMIDPFNEPLGQQTKAYAYYLAAHLTEIILLAGDSDRRWDSAVAELETLCKASGYRTDGISKQESLMAKRMWDDYLENRVTDPPASPRGADVMRRTELQVESARPNNDRVEDLRGVRLPNTYVSTAIRNEIARDVRQRTGV